eukprot:3991613-Pleurochrysis_carterae.AAC.3
MSALSQVAYDQNVLLYIEDLTARYSKPCVMDIKIGTRTFVEAEARARKCEDSFNLPRTLPHPQSLRDEDSSWPHDRIHVQRQRCRALALSLLSAPLPSFFSSLPPSPRRRGPTSRQSD